MNMYNKNVLQVELVPYMAKFCCVYSVSTECVNAISMHALLCKPQQFKHRDCNFPTKDLEF